MKKFRCRPHQHVFVYSETDEFNGNPNDYGSMMNHPYGGPGLHTCLCGKKWQVEPKLDERVKLGSMFYQIFGSLVPIDGADNHLIENRSGAFNNY